MYVIIIAWYMNSCASQHLKHHVHIHPDRILFDCQRSDYRIRGATDETLSPSWASCRCDGPDSAMVQVCIGGLPQCRRSLAALMAPDKALHRLPWQLDVPSGNLLESTDCFPRPPAATSSARVHTCGHTCRCPPACVRRGLRRPGSPVHWLFAGRL